MSIIERAAGRLQPLPRIEPTLADSADRTDPNDVLERTHRADRNDSIVTPEAPEAVSSLVQTTHLYGEINLENLEKAGMITPNGERNAISEEFRVVKRPLLVNAFDRGAATPPRANLVMVTSACPGEGKSFSAINLAMSIAMERDHTVLLVDADVAKPSLLTFLGLRPGKGLMDLLLDPTLKFSDVLIKTNVEKLNIVPAGRSHPHATELLASERMSQLLNEISTRYPDRIVIFDSPPLLATTEARVLASRMGQIVMVVEAAKTSQAAVKEALSQMDKCEIVGLLLNKGSSAIGEDQFTYSSYGGYYGSYGT